MKETFDSGLVRIRPTYQSIISELLERADELHRDAQEYGVTISLIGYPDEQDIYKVSISDRNLLSAFHIEDETYYTVTTDNEIQSIAYEDISFEILR